MLPLSDVGLLAAHASRTNSSHAITIRHISSSYLAICPEISSHFFKREIAFFQSFLVSSLLRPNILYLYDAAIYGELLKLIL
jgi:hypothetical protein